MEQGSPAYRLFCRQRNNTYRSRACRAKHRAGDKTAFRFEQFKGAPQVIDKVRDEALSVQNLDVKTRISGFDIDGDSIKMAMIHAENAGVKNLIHFQQMDMRDVSTNKIRRAYQQSAVW